MQGRHCRLSLKKEQAARRCSLKSLLQPPCRCLLAAPPPAPLPSSLWCPRKSAPAIMDCPAAGGGARVTSSAPLPASTSLAAMLSAAWAQTRVEPTAAVGILHRGGAAVRALSDSTC